MMQFEVQEIQIPEKISFNYEELKSGLMEKASLYEAVVYGDDEIKTAKADRASLNKLKQALNDERIRQEKEYMKPFDEFKAQVNEIIGIIDKPVGIIDEQIKAFEERKREEKTVKIANFWVETEHPEWLECKQIFDEKWLNASVSMKKVQEAIIAKIDEITGDIKTIESLPEFNFEAMEEYKRSLDLNRAIAEGQRLADIQKRKAEAEAKKRAEAETKQEEPPQEEPEQIAMDKPADSPAEPEEIPRSWVRFAALMSVEDARALKAFFEGRNIQFEQV